MEATGYSRWFERLLAELGFELWIGDPAEIKAKRVRKQKYDREDARLQLRLMRENHFPQIWVPSPENRDLRQLLWHRHRLVQMRTRIMNQLQALAMNENKCWKKKLWSERGRAEFEKLPLGFWARRRRQELLELLDRMSPKIEELTTAVEQEAKKRPDALRLMTHPGVLIIGTPERFARGKQIGTYVGMIPSEDSSAGKQRLGHISKQGSSLLRFLLVEAALIKAEGTVEQKRMLVDDILQGEAMQEACGMFLTVERKFRKINSHPEVVTDPRVNGEWWDALELVYRAEKTVWRMFVGPQPDIKSNRLYTKFRELLLKGSNLKADA
jgi:transposase